MTDICVVRRSEETLDDLIKRFKKKFSKSGILKDLKEKSHYEKPSDKKRRKRAQAQRLREKEEQKLQKTFRYKKKEEGVFKDE